MIPLYFTDQVNNRDISIAVLRTFIAKRKEEHETSLSKRTKTTTKVSEKDASQHVREETPNGSSENGEISNRDCEEEKASHDEPCGISEDHVKTTEGKGLAQLKPPRVLEVLKTVFIFFFFFFVFNYYHFFLLFYPILDEK